MEYEKIKQLMDDMGSSKLTAINIVFPDGTKINMKKETKQEKVLVQPVNAVSVPQEVAVANEQEVAKNKNESEKLKGNIVKSPMVGTFYLKPSPISEAYVEVGKQIKKGDTLCIIEAMKLMNEIESEFTGKVLEILVKDGEPVEYGMPLFVIS